MYAENLVVDDSCQRKIIEHFSAVTPYIDGAVLSQTFVVESVNLGNLSTLVVTSN